MFYVNNHGGLHKFSLKQAVIMNHDEAHITPHAWSALYARAYCQTIALQ